MQYGGYPPISVISQPAEHINKLTPSSVKQILILSSIQIAMGTICMILGIALVLFVTYSLAYFGAGIGLGVAFIVTGVLGIVAAKLNNVRMITVCMIANIVCTSIWATSLIGFTMGTVGSSSFGRCSYYIGGYMCPSTSYLVISSAMLLMAIAEFIITIWCAALCCGAVCICCYQSSPPPTMQMQNYQGQVVNYQGQVMNYQLGPVPQAAPAQYARHISEEQQFTDYVSPPAQSGQQAGYISPSAQPGQLAGYMTTPAQPSQQVGYMSPHAQPGQQTSYMSPPAHPGQQVGHMTPPAQPCQQVGHMTDSQPSSYRPAIITDEPSSADNQDFYRSPASSDTEMLVV